MKVVILHSELGTLRGGGENFTRNLFTSFLKRGHQVRAAFAADRHGRYPFALPAGIEPLPLSGWWSENLGQAALSAVGRQLRPWRPLRQRWDYLQSALAWRTFRWSNQRFQQRIVSRLDDTVGDADVIYVHSNAFLAREMARVRPTVLRLPGPLTVEVAPVLEQIHAVCANGDALERIRTFLGERALELPVGLDDGQFAPGDHSVRTAIGWGAGHQIVGYVGRLSHIKGVDVLACAFSQLVKRNDRARLLIVGSGEEERTLRALLKAELGSGVAHLAGDVTHERLPEFYRAMDVLVMPSRYENFSNALVEGLACGVPFVGSDVGGNRVLNDSGAGWLFVQGDVSSLAGTLAMALGDAAGRRARGAAGRRYVSGRYSWTASARRLEEIMCTLPGRLN